jgi:hypothetical protein
MYPAARYALKTSVKRPFRKREGRKKRKWIRKGSMNRGV